MVKLYAVLRNCDICKESVALGQSGLVGTNPQGRDVGAHSSSKLACLSFRSIGRHHDNQGWNARNPAKSTYNAH